MAFLQSHKVEALISYHSAALGVFPGGEPWEKNSIKFAKALAEVTDYKFPPLDTGCVFTGTLADYAVERGAVSVDMELSTHVYTDFKTKPESTEGAVGLGTIIVGQACSLTMREHATGGFKPTLHISNKKEHE